MERDTHHSNKSMKSVDNTRVVANHYNGIEEKGLQTRFESPIFYMRNFNNWVKGVSIHNYLTEIKKQLNRDQSPTVLDICCGKGGDLFKWKMGDVKHVTCVDIANISVTDCETRYESLQKKSSYRKLFSAEFIVADCTNEIISNKFRDSKIQFDLVSCQFAFHYSFESLNQAEIMMQNISNNLKEGGYFIGTVPNAYDIIQRVQKNGGTSIGNKIFKIELEFDPKNGYPLFGAKYNFHLEGVVDCPEFLVHFPTFIQLAKKYNLELIMKQSFADYFESNKEEGRSLLQKMICFQSYPTKGLEADKQEFEHAKKYVENNDKNVKSIGTISKSEWEAASIYLVFAFQKKSTKDTKE